MHTLSKMTFVELKLKLREPISTFFTLVFPLLLLLLFGSIYGNEPTPFLGGRGNVDVSVPGYIAMIIGTLGIIGLPVALAEYRDQGILRRYRATPLSSSSILSAQVVTNLAIALLGMALIVTAAYFVYDLTLPAAPLAVIVAIVFSGVSFLAMGFLLAGLMPTASAAQAVGMAIFFPMLFLSGAGMPQAILPDAMVKVSQFLPLTYVVNLLQDLWVGKSWNVTAVLVLAGMMIAATAVSTRTFRWE
ncbi:MAG: ABC transporter permease [Ardenticatenaceae bacterium]|nr:ABC transporter permease [Ardenticatenaceae bacterium]